MSTARIRPAPAHPRRGKRSSGRTPRRLVNALVTGTACVFLILLPVGCGGSKSTVGEVSRPCRPLTYVAPGGVRVGALYGVDAAAASDVWAVGTDDASGDGSGSTLVLRWDGSRWSRVASPSPDHELTALWDVVGVSVADAWAVGYSGKGGLIEHWDGSAWSEVPVSLPDDFLQGIDAATADDIWAVGAHGTTGRPRPVVVHWDGKSWREIATPGLPQGTPYGLSAVSAVAADDVWAVGAVITNPVTEASV